MDRRVLRAKDWQISLAMKVGRPLRLLCVPRVKGALPNEAAERGLDVAICVR
jgi:hypothetical protein